MVFTKILDAFKFSKPQPQPQPLTLTLDNKRQACRLLFYGICDKYAIKGWKIEFDGLITRAYAYTCYDTQTVRMSKRVFHCASASYLRNIILHEVAHILEPDHGHDQVWKNRCVELGINPDRLVSPVLMHRYHVKCYNDKCKSIRFLHGKNRSRKCFKCKKSNTYIKTISWDVIAEYENKKSQLSLQSLDELTLDYCTGI
jgi:hypothetical protein